MAIIKNAELWYTKLDPKKPNASFNKEQPTWEVQIRTRSKAQMTEWKGLGLKPKMDEDQDGKAFWRVNLKKKSKKKDGEAVAPVKVVNGALEDVDPKSIGNGSIGDVRVFQYDYDVGGKQGLATMLMAIQLKKHIVYEPPASEDDFEMTETETVRPADSFGDNDGEGEPKKPNPKNKPNKSLAEMDDDIPF